MFRKSITAFFSALFKTESGWMRWIIALLLIAYFAFQNTSYFNSVRMWLSHENLTLSLGARSFSAYEILNGLITVIAVFWVASLIAVWAQRSVGSLDSIKVSTRSLITSMLKLAIFAIAGIVCLNTLGIDMSSLALLSGAIGIGLGFGLQKITSNFISGIILLFEQSMEEGDLVELTVGEQGIVKRMGARYTLIETFDGKEVMIPNEDFITNRVTNWTFSNEQGRAEIRVGIGYESDVDLAHQLMIEAAKKHPRCSKNPEPACFVTDFGDSSINFLLYFWVDDVVSGRLEPKSFVYREIWRSFQANNISIPYPQSDVTIKNWDKKPI